MQQGFEEFIAPLRAKLEAIQKEVAPKLDEMKRLKKSISVLSGTKPSRRTRAKKAA